MTVGHRAEAADGRVAGMRLFVAVWPPAEVADAIAALPRPDVPGLRWTTPDQWHVTLRFLGWVERPELALDAFRHLRCRGPVVAVAGPTLRRFGQRVLHLPVDGLEPLAAAAVAATAGVGRAPDDRPFTGHLTLARARGRGRPVVDLAPFTHVEMAAAWSVEEVTLVRSTPAPGGSRYEIVERVAVGPGEGP